MTSKQARGDHVVRSPRGAATRERILDAAEALFAQNGFKATSLREISAHGDIQFGLTTYYFGSKMALIESVLSRRAAAGERALSRALDRVENGQSACDPAAILTAFADTILRPLERENPAGVNYMRLLIHFQRERELRTAFGSDDPVMQPHYPVRKRYLASLERTMPDLDPAVVLFGFEIFEGAFGKLLFDSQLDIDDVGLQQARVAEMRRCLVPFCAGGFRSFGSVGEIATAGNIAAEGRSPCSA